MNRVQLIGHLGRDAENKPANGTRARTIFSVATNRRWKDEQSGDWKEQTDWHDIVAWGKLADATASLTKGTRVFVEGQLRSREYKKDEVTHRAYEVVADTVAPIAKSDRAPE